jgi:RNA polymerase sigma-70 factor (ECF subfamily)
VDPRLVVRAQAGDREAFASLAAGSLGRLNGVARLILRDRDAADDAVQDALVAAWRSLRALREPDRFDAWLSRLLVRACYDHARRGTRRRAVEAQVTPIDEPSAADAQSTVVIRDQLERVLGRLSTEQRAAVVLVYYLDLSLPDAAASLGIPVGTLKSRLHRALGALHAIVDADERAAVRKESPA